MKNNQEQAFQYAAIIRGAIAEMLNEDSESDYKIPLSDFDDEDKATAFLHALANVVPCDIYKKLTQDDIDILGFNHIANRLIFQFTKKVENN